LKRKHLKRKTSRKQHGREWSVDGIGVKRGKVRSESKGK
jgi:hypothetical protein